MAIHSGAGTNMHLRNLKVARHWNTLAPCCLVGLVNRDQNLSYDIVVQHDVFLDYLFCCVVGCDGETNSYHDQLGLLFRIPSPFDNPFVLGRTAWDCKVSQLPATPISSWDCIQGFVFFSLDVPPTSNKMHWAWPSGEPWLSSPPHQWPKPKPLPQVGATLFEQLALVRSERRHLKSLAIDQLPTVVCR